jgi:hypothetical protein
MPGCHDARVDLLAVVEVIGERRADVGQREIVLGGDLIGILTEPIMPDRDVLDRDTAATDTRLTTSRDRLELDVGRRAFCWTRLPL